MTSPRQMKSGVEFVVLVAFVTSLVALATDIMLPALPLISAAFALPDANEAQLIVSSFFLGLAIGQIFAGPLSDRFGRRPVIFFGYVMFVLGCWLSMVTDDWTIMLLGRVLQGLGASAPRIAIMALVRDIYEGRAMARILSIVSAIFIIVPVIAPALGQGVIWLGGWRATFASMVLLALVSAVWLGLRQPETLARDHRRAFSAGLLWTGFMEILRTPATLGYTLAAGLIFGAFLGYLSSAQQIFQTTYGVGDLFAVYFAVAAISIGIASATNARLVMVHGMRSLTRLALIVSSCVSLLFVAILVPTAGVPPLWLFMVWLLIVFFCMGLLFGNLNALAMEPMGHMAGLGAAFIGSLSTLMSLPVGLLVGQMYDGTVSALVIGFGVLGAMSWGVMEWTERRLRT